MKIEKIAKIQHDIWAHWMKYLFTKGNDMPDGSFVIDADSVERWKRQMNTSYEDLSEKEQESDIRIVKDFMPFFSFEEDNFISLEEDIDVLVQKNFLNLVDGNYE
jgi:hypothetical protein